MLAGAAAPKPGDKTAKDATHLTTAIALLVAKTLGALASLDPVKLQIVNSSALPALLLLFKSEQLEPKWQAVRIMALCCGLEALHEKLAGANLVHQAMVIADYDNAGPGQTCHGRPAGERLLSHGPRVNAHSVIPPPPPEGCIGVGEVPPPPRQGSQPMPSNAGGGLARGPPTGTHRRDTLRLGPPPPPRP